MQESQVNAPLFASDDLIYSYTRKQAIDDGILVALSGYAPDEIETWIPAMVSEVGIRVPLCVTRTLWDELVAMNPRAEQAMNDIKGRLWDVLFMFVMAVRRGANEDQLKYTLRVVLGDGSRYGNRKTSRSQVVQVRAVCGPDDDGSPCFTLMMHDED